METKYWMVKLVCGEKKEMVVRDYAQIPAPTEDDARLWGKKQAEVLELPEPHFIVVHPAVEEAKAEDMSGVVV